MHSYLHSVLTCFHLLISQDIIDKTTRLEGQANDLQKQVDATKVRIKGEDDLISGIQQAGNKVGFLFQCVLHATSCLGYC